MRKLLPYVFTFLTLAAMAVYILHSGLEGIMRPIVRTDLPETPEATAPAPEESRVFHGRVEFPPVEDILVLENSAERDMEKLATYFEGRSAGLHWLARPHFKSRKNPEDVVMGLRLSLDSLGQFKCEEIEFNNAEDSTFTQAVKWHVERYWRYRRSDSGKTELWLPVIFRASY